MLWNPHAPPFATVNWRKLLEDMDKSIDAVTISTPDHHHGIAGIQAAKRTPDLIPLCHPLAIDAVTVDRVNAYLKKNTPGPFTIVTVGPKELKLPSA